MDLTSGHTIPSEIQNCKNLKSFSDKLKKEILLVWVFSMIFSFSDKLRKISYLSSIVFHHFSAYAEEMVKNNEPDIRNKIEFQNHKKLKTFSDKLKKKSYLSDFFIYFLFFDYIVFSDKLEKIYYLSDFLNGIVFWWFLVWYPTCLLLSVYLFHLLSDHFYVDIKIVRW